MQFYYVYILENKEKKFRYIGKTKDLFKRFKLHNNNKVNSTKFYTPLDLIYYEAYRNKLDDNKREKYFKTSKGKTTLNSMLKNYYTHL